MPRVAFVVEYDGTDFSGSQFQVNARTVQGELEHAARLVLKIGEQRIQMASRTDAGVHAKFQIAACDTQVSMETDALPDAMNANLTRDLAVRKAVVVSDSFDPRRDAEQREYHYTINTTGIRSPFSDRFEVVMNADLDVDLMDSCAQRFIGTQDFASFAAIDRDGPPKSTVRHVEVCRVEPYADSGRKRLRIIVAANSFLRQQVRRMTGMLIAVGSGKAQPGLIQQHLDEPVIGAVSTPAPARGLCLRAIKYPSGCLSI